MWASTYYHDKLRKLQIKAIRIISKNPLRDRITPCYQKLKVLKLDELYKFEIGKLIYTHKMFPYLFQDTHKMLPDLFQDYFSDSTSTHSYTICDMHPKTLCLFPVILPQEINNLSNVLVPLDNISAIRQYSYPRPSDNILILNSGF